MKSDFAVEKYSFGDKKHAPDGYYCEFAIFARQKKEETEWKISR